jgi:glycosyltransferase involved in cell wall biosynthesis
VDAISVEKNAPVRRVVFFSHAATFGGAEKDLFELVIALSAKPGWEVLVVIPGAGEQARILGENGVRVVLCSLPWMRTVAVADSLPDLHEAMSRLERGWIDLVTRVLPSLEEFQPDVIVSQTCTIPWGYFSAALLDKPHVWNLREYGELDHSLVPMIAGVVDDTAISQTADLVFACSEVVGRHWAARIGGTFRVLYSIPQIGPSGGRQAIHGQKSVGLRVVQVGALSPGKGPAVLLEAAKHMANQGVDVHVQFVGDGPQRVDLENQSRALGLDRAVEFLGWRSDVAEVVSRSDVAVSCSLNEAYGRTLPEAASLGVVPVFPDTPNWAETFTSGVDGLSYERGNALDLAKSLMELTDEVRRAELAARARALAERDFGHRDPADVFIEAVEGLLEGDQMSHAATRVSQGAYHAVLKRQILRTAELELRYERLALDASESEKRASRRVSAAQGELDRAMAGFRSVDQECESLRIELAEAQGALAQIERSRAWRLVEAMRRLHP